jgi:hypothetical protein
MKLLKSIGIILPSVIMGGVQAEMVIDFTDAECFPTGRHDVQINNIRVDTEITNPFTGETQIQSVGYDVPFKLDLERLVLAPDLGDAATDDESRNCADLTVMVNNAVTGEGIPYASVDIGGGNMLQADEWGAVSSTGLSEGTMEVSVSAEGFGSSAMHIPLICTDEGNSIAFNLNPTEGENALSSNEIRAVLSWGLDPTDLDAHFTGPSPGQPADFANEEERFHMYWNAEIATGGGVALLDVDDVDSYGPETITLSPAMGETQLRPGTYRYTVYHYAGLGMIDDSVTVELYVGTDSARTFKPPVDDNGIMFPDTEGNIWTVFELYVDEAGSVTVRPIDELNYTSDGSGSVRNGRNPRTEPVNILYGK